MSEDLPPSLPEEHWVEGHLNLSPDQTTPAHMGRIVNGIVRPTLDQNQDLIETFHFLTEPRSDNQPGSRLLFRIEVPDTDSKDEIERRLRHTVEENDDLLDRYRLTQDYPGEGDDYGADGWDVMKRSMQIGSEIHLARLDSNADLRHKFATGKLVHCYLNPQMIDEEVFHVRQFVNRCAIRTAVEKHGTVTEETLEDAMSDAQDRARQRLEKTLESLDEGSPSTI